MGFSIQYRSTQTMHPARAFEVKDDAARLITGFTWLSCEPVILEQQTDGYLFGSSKPNFFPAGIDIKSAKSEGLPDGTVMTMTDVLCELSRRHKVDWQVGHDYEPEPIGEIRSGIIDPELLEQLEAFGSIGELLDDLVEEGDDAESWSLMSMEPVDHGDDEGDDEGPRVLKFPGRD